MKQTMEQLKQLFKTYQEQDPFKRVGTVIMTMGMGMVMLFFGLILIARGTFRGLRELWKSPKKDSDEK